MRAKISGITDLFTALTADECGAAFVSFMFDVDNKDYIEPEVASVLARQIPGTRTVGVFTDEELSRVNLIADMVGLDYVQLNGDESDDYMRQVVCPVIKRYYVDEHFSVEKAEQNPAEMILLDLGEQDYHNKKLANDIVQLHKSVIVAGEINRENVLDVECKLHPYAVDVSEGIEACNGQKSVRKIRGLFRRMGSRTV